MRLAQVLAQRIKRSNINLYEKYIYRVKSSNSMNTMFMVELRFTYYHNIFYKKAEILLVI